MSGTHNKWQRETPKLQIVQRCQALLFQLKRKSEGNRNVFGALMARVVFHGSSMILRLRVSLDEKARILKNLQLQTLIFSTACKLLLFLKMRFSIKFLLLRILFRLLFSLREFNTTINSERCFDKEFTESCLSIHYCRIHVDSLEPRVWVFVYQSVYVNIIVNLMRWRLMQ